MPWVGGGHSSLAGGSGSGWEEPMPTFTHLESFVLSPPWTNFHLGRGIAAAVRGCLGWTMSFLLCTKLTGAVDPQAAGGVGGTGVDFIYH